MATTLRLSVGRGYTLPALAGVAVTVVIATAGLPSPSLGADVDMTTVAGRINDEPVSLGEVDEVLNGSVARLWREEAEIVRVSAREICRRRALAQLFVRDGKSEREWKSEVWKRSVPTEAEVDASLSQLPDAASVGDARLLVRHRLRVRSYRRQLQESADREIGDDFSMVVAGGDDATDTSEPRIPRVVARCLGGTVSGSEVEGFAAFPLFRRRAELVMSVCAQFDIDYSNPLVLERVAKQRGISVDEMMAQVGSTASFADDDDVRALALHHYGRADGSSLDKARLALNAERKVTATMAFVDRLRRTTSGRCSLSMPPPPVVHPVGSVLRPRGQGGSGARPKDTATPSTGAQGTGGKMAALYFGAFDCRHCEEGWRSFQRFQDRWQGKIEVRFRNHFPETVLPAFEDALGAECARGTGRLRRFGQWRLGTGRSPAVQLDTAQLAKAIDLREAALSACMDDPRTAVAVLDDTEEALRLGFREAVPSWVIGRRPRRGFQGDRILDETVQEQLRGAASKLPGSVSKPKKEETP